MARVKGNKLIIKEPPQLFCHKCRCWVESNEKVEMFASIDRPPQIWTCPRCRGEIVTPEQLDAPLTSGHDRMMAAKYGLPRRIVERLEDRGKMSYRAKLECGHVMTVHVAQKQPRCRKCRPEEP